MTTLFEIYYEENATENGPACFPWVKWTLNILEVRRTSNDNGKTREKCKNWAKFCRWQLHRNADILVSRQTESVHSSSGGNSKLEFHNCFSWWELCCNDKPLYVRPWWWNDDAKTQFGNFCKTKIQFQRSPAQQMSFFFFKIWSDFLSYFSRSTWKSKRCPQTLHEAMKNIPCPAAVFSLFYFISSSSSLFHRRNSKTNHFRFSPIIFADFHHLQPTKNTAVSLEKKKIHSFFVFRFSLHKKGKKKTEPTRKWAKVKTKNVRVGRRAFPWHFHVMDHKIQHARRLIRVWVDPYRTEKSTENVKCIWSFVPFGNDFTKEEKKKIKQNAKSYSKNDCESLSSAENWLSLFCRMNFDILFSGSCMRWRSPQHTHCTTSAKVVKNTKPTKTNMKMLKENCDKKTSMRM